MPSNIRAKAVADQENRFSRGQAIAEFALVSPLLLLFLLGVFDFGRAVSAYITLSHAVREGARAGIYTSSTDSDIRNAINSQAGILGNLPDSNISISPSYPRASGANLQVSVAYDFTAITPLVSAFWGGGSLRISDTATVKVE